MEPLPAPDIAVMVALRSWERAAWLFRPLLLVLGAVDNAIIASLRSLFVCEFSYCQFDYVPSNFIGACLLPNIGRAGELDGERCDGRDGC